MPRPYGTLRRLEGVQSVTVNSTNLGSEGEISAITVSHTPTKVGALIFVKGILSGGRDHGAGHLATVILRKKDGTAAYTGIHGAGDYTCVDKWNDSSAGYLDWETEVAHFDHWFVAESTAVHKLNVAVIPYEAEGGTLHKNTSGTVFFNRPAQGVGALFDGQMYCELCVYEMLPGGTMVQIPIATRDLP